MNCEIILLRHGECEGQAYFRGQSNPRLTSTGLQAVLAQCNRLCNPIKPDAIFTSPLSRCLEPAESCAENFNLPLTFLPDWQERHFGLWDGLTLNEIQQNWPHELEAYFADPFNAQIPQAENYADFQARIDQAWCFLGQKIALNHWQKILLITHGGPIRLLLQRVLGLPNDALFHLELDYAVAIKLQWLQTSEMNAPFIKLKALLPREG